MLNCKEVADRASALIDGELSLWDALQMRLHLAMCKGCSNFINQMRATDRLVADVFEVDTDRPHVVGDSHLAEILLVLREEKRRHRKDFGGAGHG